MLGWKILLKGLLESNRSTAHVDKVKETYSMGFPLISAMMALSPPRYS